MDLPQPITREELYLAYYVGLRGFALPPEPATRIELYLAKLCGKQSVQLPSRPVTNAEIYLAKLCGENVQLPAEPILRVDFYLAKLCGEDVQLPPEPYTKTEAYLAFAATSEVSEVVISGEMSTIEDTLEGIGFSEVQLLGDSFQQTYTGKNLFDYSDRGFPHTNHGVTATLDNDGTITVSGIPDQNYVTICSWVDITDLLEDGETYTMSQATASTDFYMQITRSAGTSPADNTNLQGVVKRSFTVDKTAHPTYKIGAVTGTASSWGDATKDVSQRFQLEKGSTATDFEPYVGGIPAPNPDYPQDIQVVTGEQTVEVRGKNFMPLQNAVIDDDNRYRIFNIALPAGTYTVSFNIDSFELGTNASADVHLSLFSKSGTNILNTSMVRFDSSTVVGSRVAKSFTISEDANATSNQIRINTTYYNNSARISLSDIQIELGSTATDYVPYQGQSYEVNLGKNLFDKDNALSFDRMYINANTGLFAQTGVSATALTVAIPCQPNTTYTVSKTAGTRFAVATCESMPTVGATADGAIADNTSNSITITTGANAAYLAAWVYNSTDSGTSADMVDSVQIELGSEATTYAPYFTPIELCKIGTYQDYIWTDGEKWYKHKSIEKRVFTGDSSEPWQATTLLTNTRSFRIDSSIGAIATGADSILAYVDKFTGNLSGASVDKECFWFNGSGYIRIRVALARLSGSTADDFKDWLAANPVTVYYPLATPTDEEITNATLISQLNALANAYGYAGQTNFFIAVDDPNLPVGLKLKVRRAA